MAEPVPLDAEAVEAVAKALIRKHRTGFYDWVFYAEVAILAADKARGMRVEDGKYLVTHPTEHGQRWERNGQYRLVSRWFPIKGPVDE